MREANRCIKPISAVIVPKVSLDEPKPNGYRLKGHTYPKKPIPPETRARVLELSDAGKTTHFIAHRLGIHFTLVNRIKTEQLGL